MTKSDSELGVWAPKARRVELVTAVGRRALAARPSGWWVDGTRDGHDAPYGFALDGGPTRPDPRARRLPDGVEGFAQAFDPRAFAWTDHAYRGRSWSDAVVYELHVGTFTEAGTFEGVLDKLDYLVDLGVTHVELMPVHAFPGSRSWGYDGVGLFAADESYGGPEGLCRLVDGCHRRGLGVILDVVYNHLGPESNYLGEFGPYFLEGRRTPWGPSVNLDEGGADHVRRFFLDNARMWLRDFHFDGLRLDAAQALEDRTAIHWLEELSEETESLAHEVGRPLTLIAEIDTNDPRVVRPRCEGGLGMNAQWSDDFHHAIHALLTGERAGYYADFGRVEDVARGLTDAFILDGRYAVYRGRRHGRPAGDVPGECFVVYAQNHDQVGNRPRGDRISAVVSPARVRMFATLVLLSPYVPMLFMGEEWGASAPFPFFCDFANRHLRKVVADFRARELAHFGWDVKEMVDPLDPAAFEGARLDWSELAKGEHAQLHDWYRRLLRLRTARPELRDGRRKDVDVRFSEGRWLTFGRGRVTAAFNLGDEPVRLEHVEGAVELAYPAAEIDAQGGLRLPAEAVAVTLRASGPRSPA